MQLQGIHFLLTYTCLRECDHCFVWGSPAQSATMTRRQVREVLGQAQRLGGVEWIYFEGGEPFLFYALLLDGVRHAAELGFRVGLVSNAYWATSIEDARRTLLPMTGLVHDLSLSSDVFHGDAEGVGERVRNAQEAAASLGIPAEVIRIVECASPAAVRGQLPPGESQVMYRGRAAKTLAPKAPATAWEQYDSCPHEELGQPERLHVDPLGYAHVCQGISLGNVFDKGLEAICADYEPSRHPIVGPLLQGGPAELVRRYDAPVLPAYADACHLCDATRRALRSRFPEQLAPDAMYGVMES